MSTRKRPYQFYVLEDFRATVNGNENQYHKGHAYTVRPGKPWDDLDSKVDGWLVEGRVALVRGV